MAGRTRTGGHTFVNARRSAQSGRCGNCEQYEECANNGPAGRSTPAMGFTPPQACPQTLARPPAIRPAPNLFQYLAVSNNSLRRAAASLDSTAVSGQEQRADFALKIPCFETSSQPPAQQFSVRFNRW
jgi:hypothetical protein